MTAAIFGLLGVVVGGLLTGGVDYFMARRREQAELRQSTRLVADELHSLWLVVDLILERGQLLPARLPGEDTELLFPTSSWHAHKAVLARALRQKEWIALATVYAAVENMRPVMLRTPDLPLDAEGSLALTEMRDQTARLYTQLTGHQL